MQNEFIIGTRGSLLAVTQCTLIKEEIESLSDKKFILKKIKTQGDKITDKPLWQLEGKDFFTKELDTALLKNEIDMVVHSYKDLGSERPDGIELGCITERKYAQDILLIKKEKVNELSNLAEFTVGTSSPRRIFNIEEKLSKFLPVQGLEIKTKMLRGNVNTRIEKLLNNEYDAIVLALAGIERLANSPESKIILQGLLKDLTFLILPQKVFPSSASQGALAIEYNKTREDDLAKTLRCVHHEKTQEEISRERSEFAKYGGGCHLAVGIHVKKLHDYFIHIHHGSLDGKKIKKLFLEGHDYSIVKGQKVYSVYGEYDFLINKIKIDNETNENQNLFVTSTYCSHNIKKYNSIWSAGNKTMKQLFKKGFWVNGSAEGFGHAEIEILKESKAIKMLLGDSPWTVLSHNKASSVVGDVVSCYSHQENTEYSDELQKAIISSDIIFWSSIIQFETYTTKFPELKLKRHACGLGKTLNSFKELGIDVIPCIDMNHLKEQI